MKYEVGQIVRYENVDFWNGVLAIVLRIEEDDVIVRKMYPFLHPIYMKKHVVVNFGSSFKKGKLVVIT